MDRDSRLCACALVRTRFAGRAALTELARRSDVALARLELRLGLGDEEGVRREERLRATDELRQLVMGDRGYMMPEDRIATLEAIGYLLAGSDYAAREAMASRRYVRDEGNDESKVRRRVARIVAQAECERIDALRAQRAHARTLDALACRPERWIERKLISAELDRQMVAARWRTARHEHRDQLSVCEPGDERAWSVEGRSWTMRQQVHAYRYPNATSEHHVRASRTLISREVRTLNAQCPRRVMYLRVDLRVRQSRGTSLVLEHRGPKGGWR